MNKYIIILIVFLLVVFLFTNTCSQNNKEHYKIVDGEGTTDGKNFIKTQTDINTNVNTSKYKKNDDKKNKLSDKGIRKGSDPLDGQLFEDVIMYKNDNKLDGEIGVEKCMKLCKGMCVEYGTTGESFCYPKEYALIKQDLQTVQNELSQSEYR